jgi:hypothetical protein
VNRQEERMNKLIVFLLAAIAIAHGAKSIITQRVDFSLMKYKPKDRFGRETHEERNVAVPISGGLAVLIGTVEIAGALIFIIVAGFTR